MQKDIINGLFFIAGIFSFISGVFIVSTAMFAAAALLSNLDFKHRINA